MEVMVTFFWFLVLTLGQEDDDNVNTDATIGQARYVAKNKNKEKEEKKKGNIGEIQLQRVSLTFVAKFKKKT